MPNVDDEIKAMDEAQDSRSGPDYGQLLAEARGEAERTVPEIRSHTRENFLYNANDIFDTIHRVLDESEDGNDRPPRLLKEAYAEATKLYILEAEPEYPGLKMQAEIILGAPLVHIARRELEDVQKQTKSGNDSDELYYREKELVDTLIGYSHLVRDFILAYPDTFTQHDLTNWLSKASRNNHVWAQTLVAGISAEVAVMRSMQDLPGTSNVRPGTVIEDRRGIDLVWTGTNGKSRNIDVKSGASQPQGGVYHKSGTVEIGVENGAIQDFRLRSEFERELLERISNSLASNSKCTSSF